MKAGGDTDGETLGAARAPALASALVEGGGVRAVAVAACSSVVGDVDAQESVAPATATANAARESTALRDCRSG